ncbi:Na/Pi cotransporter family protein [Prosthecomicrobium sp. N25]|uniref:Na/Pi cotransporter family protein n=1 Tax=Prosthecomicrobium sp. N25 TaxID=3129254 RepID=UPI003077E8E2
MSAPTLVLVDLLGASALLLWGLRTVKSGVSAAFGDRLRHGLALWTRRRIGALLAGIGVTLALQSSTATALIAGAFAGRDILSGASAQAVMLGANIGTAIVAKVLAVGLEGLAPFLVFAGVVAATGGSGRRRGLGQAIVGLGLMLLALRLLGTATEPLRHSEVIRSVLGALAEAPVLAFLSGGILAFLASSSLAVVLLVLSMATAGGLEPPLVLALVLGANVGGAVPPVVATLGQSAAARRLTIGNLGTRAAGALVLLPLLGPATDAILAVTGQPERLAVDAHLAFSLALTVVAWPFIGAIARATASLVPEPPASRSGPRYLDDTVLDTPAAALGCAARETLRVGDLVESMLVRSFEAFRVDDADLLEDIARLDDEVDRLQQAVKLYIARLDPESLDEAGQARAAEIIDYVVNLEHIGDIVEKGLAGAVSKKIRNGLQLSTDGSAEIVALHEATLDNFRRAQSLFVSRDLALARSLFAAKVEIRRLEKVSAERHFERLRAGRLESLRTSSLHLDILRDLKRINAHVASVAQPILDAHGDLTASRLRDSGAPPGPAAPNAA